MWVQQVNNSNTCIGVIYIYSFIYFILRQSLSSIGEEEFLTGRRDTILRDSEKIFELRYLLFTRKRLESIVVQNVWMVATLKVLMYVFFIIMFIL